MQLTKQTDRYADAFEATTHSIGNFCMDPYALAGTCQVNAKVITLN